MAEGNLAAVVYDAGQGFEADALLRGLADRLKAAGVRVAGTVQRAVERTDRRGCDMVVRDLATDTEHLLSEDRGPFARGCRLNTEALEDLVGSTETALARGAALLIVNKFGKQEALGAGFRQTIAQAVGDDLPTIVGVNRRFLAEWQAFVGELGEQLAPDQAAVEAWVLARVAAGGTAAVTDPGGAPTQPAHSALSSE